MRTFPGSPTNDVCINTIPISEIPVTISDFRNSSHKEKLCSTHVLVGKFWVVHGLICAHLWQG